MTPAPTRTVVRYAAQVATPETVAKCERLLARAHAAGGCGIITRHADTIAAAAVFPTTLD